MRLPKISKKSAVYWSAIFLLTGIGVFGLLSVAQADDTIPGFVADALASIAQVLIELVGKVLVVLIQILLAVVQYNDFINAPAVVKSWILIRDFANMAFLIIFIAIAFATILGVEKYEYKQLLPKLLMMAVLINFSRTICGLIIDAAQVVMMTFVNGFKEVAAGNLIRGFGLTDMLTLRDLGKEESGISDSALAAASILAVVLLIIATVTVGVIVLMFLIRIIYLWILIMLSPLAFMLAAAPGLSGKFSEWWDKFVRYAMVGPVMAFFLWMSFSIMAQVKPGENLARSSNIAFKDNKVESAIDTRVSATITEVGQADNLLSYGIAIALLLLSLTVANEIGVKGGQLAGSALAKIQSGGLKLGKLAGLGLATGGIGTIGGAALTAGALGFGTKRGRQALDWLNRKQALGKYGTGIDLNLARSKKGIKESLEFKKRREEIGLAVKAGEGFRKGGPLAVVKGFLGAPRDGADAYIQGAFNWKGFRNMWRTTIGGPEAVKKIMQESNKEKFEAEKAAKELAMRDEALKKGNFDDEGTEEFVKAHSDERVRENRALELAEADNYLVQDDGSKLSLKDDLKSKAEDLLGSTSSTDDRKELVAKTVDELVKVGSDKAADVKRKYLEEWEERKAGQQLRNEVKAAREFKGSWDSPAGKKHKQVLDEVQEKGKKKLEEQAEEKKQEAERLARGGISDAEKDTRRLSLNALQDTLEKIDRDIISQGERNLSTLDLQNEKKKVEDDIAKIGKKDAAGNFVYTKDNKVIEKARQNLLEARRKEAQARTENKTENEQAAATEERIKAEAEFKKAEKGALAVNLDANVVEEAKQKLAEAQKKETEATTGDEKKAAKSERIKAEAELKEMEEAMKEDGERMKMKVRAELEVKRLNMLAQAPDWKGPAGEAERAKIQEEADGFKAQAARHSAAASAAEVHAREYIPPRAFYAERDRRALEDEEMRKITSELDTELIADFKDAVTEGNAIKAVALAKKLANDYNDNELWNAYGFDSTAEGMGKFIDAVLMGKKDVKRDSDGSVYTGPSLKMAEQTALAVQNDISFINESRKHWETARTIEVENGMFKRMSGLQHAQAALTEIVKGESADVIRAFNRLAFGGERPSADGTSRDFRMTPLGVGILSAFAPEFHFRFGRGEYNKNAILNIGTKVADLERLGLPAELLEELGGKFKKVAEKSGKSAKEIGERAFTMMMQQGMLK